MAGEMGGADDRDGSRGALPVRGRRRFDGGRHGVVIPFSNQELDQTLAASLECLTNRNARRYGGT